MVIGIPLTLVMTAEILITINEVSLGKVAQYRVTSDFDSGFDGILNLPGPKTAAPAPPASPDDEHRYLVELYAPVFIHQVSFEPHWDIPMFIEFDGNEDPRDNVQNTARGKALEAGVYGEVTAETERAYYLTYSLYHIKDYDHPVRQLISRYTYHDNDNEGLKMRVDKTTMKVTEVEAWFHNRFFLCNDTGISKGSEPIQAKAHFENGTHLIVFAQSMGHGVRCAQSSDLELLGDHAKIIRLRGQRQAVPMRPDYEFQTDCTYTLKDFDRWYAMARGPFGRDSHGLFDDTIVLGVDAEGQPLVIGRYIAGGDHKEGSWSRPKPMWSWDDGWDEIPIFVWHYFPSYAFASHMGIEVAQDYLYNGPVEKTFAMKPSELFSQLTLQVEKRSGKKWSRHLAKRGDRVGIDYYFKALRVLAKKYVNYLFASLG
jgi:hypothetical protein